MAQRIARVFSQLHHGFGERQRIIEFGHAPSQFRKHRHGPLRIIVGEVRGPEALDLLKAWNTGHPGGLTTLHANSAHAALTRLEQLIGEATQTIPRALIAEAVDIIVYLSRASGTRRVEEAIRITGFDGEGYVTEPLAAPRLSIVQQGAQQ